MSALAQSNDTPLFRVFLLGGDALVSYGEFARVGDRVVLTVPLGDKPDAMKLHMISVPAGDVDWPRTEEYAAAVRAKRYADTRGEDDFTLLAASVTQALNDIHLQPDARRRIAMAEEARGNLAAWPAANHGYRAADVAQLVEMLDNVIAEMRAGAGGSQFDLALVATTPPPAPVELLPPPDARTSLEFAVSAALAAAEPSERIALLRAIVQELAVSPAPRSAADGIAALQARATAALNAELKVETAYAELSRTTLREATSRAERGDVRGLQQVIARALSTDERLGRRRTGEMAALLAALDARLDDARRVQVAQEALAKRAGLFRDYARDTETPRERFAGFRRRLEQIKGRSGPAVRRLQSLEIDATLALYELQRVPPPPELHTAHGLFVAALQMTRNAASLRRNALSSRDNPQLAWDASSAAAGALMLAERGADELNRLISAASKFPR